MKVALVSGFLQAAEDLRALENSLIARGLVVDSTDIPTLLQLDPQKDAITRFCTRFRDAELWVGYSMGARVVLHALCHAVERNSLPAGLVLLSGTPGLHEEADRQERRVIDAQRATALRTDPRGFVLGWGQLPLFDALRRHASFHELQEQRLQRIDREWVALWSHALSELGPGHMDSQWEQLPHFPVPLLFLAGDQDPKFQEIAMRAAASAPHARAQIVSDAGHALPLEKPAQVADEILQFVQEIASTPSRSAFSADTSTFGHRS